MSARPQLADAIRDARVLSCLECGKCTASCPVARHQGALSPRRLARLAVHGAPEALLAEPSLWSCLGCGVCETRCPVDVDFTELLQSARVGAVERGVSGPVCTHGGVLHALARLMASPESRQNRTDWVDDDLEVAAEGEIALFVGCAPYLDVYFEELGVQTLEASRAAVRILNRAGIVPAVMADERCCGHDLLWSGDEAGYRRLMERNLEALEATGAKTVVTTCAECYRTLAQDYPRDAGRPPWQARHLSELVAELLEAGELQLDGAAGNGGHTFTYQDPCRLGRHSGVYEAPRQVLGRVAGSGFVEMDRNRSGAQCCGTSAWINCDATSKAIQAERLRSAGATGASTLVTACPKCLIHFRCALQDEALATDAGVEIEDLTVLTAQSLAEV